MAKKPTWSRHQMMSENRATSAEIDVSLPARDGVGPQHPVAQQFYKAADKALYDSRVARGVQDQPFPARGSQMTAPQAKAFAEANHAYQSQKAAASQDPQSGGGVHDGGRGWANPNVQKAAQAARKGKAGR